MIVLVVGLVDNTKPDFRPAGQTRCGGCRRWCWLDDDGFRVLFRKDVVPLCIPCASRTVSADALVGNVQDVR